MRIKQIPFMCHSRYFLVKTLQQKKKRKEKKNREINPFMLNKTLEFLYLMQHKTHTRENLLKISSCCHHLVFCNNSFRVSTSWCTSVSK